MKISTKGRYALEAVVDLGLNSADGHESLKNIAGRRGFSENYLEQIFILLRKKNIVESIRGAQGGYKLTRDPSLITAGEIIRAAEGDTAITPCISSSKDDKVHCDRYETCVARILWSKIADEVNDITESVTIADLMNTYKKLQISKGPEYYI